MVFSTGMGTTLLTIRIRTAGLDNFVIGNKFNNADYIPCRLAKKCMVKWFSRLILENPRKTQTIGSVIVLKRVGYLYQDMLDKDLIRKAIIKALCNKGKDKSVLNILNNLEKYVDYFYNTLLNKEYTFQKGYLKTIQSDRKTRKIQVPTLKDHIMQHIIMAVLSPIIMKSMYKWNCGVIPKRGPIYAKNYIQKVIKKHKPKYVFKMDVKKYFENIDTNILLKQLECKIKDKRFLTLMANLLNSANDNTGVGIPIGFYSSQWLSNFYLQDLDYFIKQELGVKYYVRYMDDLVIMGDNKRKLHQIKRKIFYFMEHELKIKPNNKYQVFLLRARNIDFVGYLINYKGAKVRKRTFKIFKRRLNALKNKINIFLCRSYISLRGWLVHCNYGLAFLKKNEPYKLYNKIKEYISNKDKENNYERLCKSF